MPSQYTSSNEPNVNKAVWETGKINGQWKIFCKACHDRLEVPQGRNPYRSGEHEKSATHTANLSRVNSAANKEKSCRPDGPAVPISNMFDMLSTHLLHSWQPVSARSESLPSISEYRGTSAFEQYSKTFDLNAMLREDVGFEDVEDTSGLAGLMEQVCDVWEFGPQENEFGDDSWDVASDSELPTGLEDDEDTGFNESFFMGTASKKRREDVDNLSQWFPWDSRLSCTMDILMHLPRSSFSTRQFDLFLWLLRVNGVNNVPSTKSIKELNANLQKLFGIQTYQYKGAFGHTYFVNSLADIIAQEMANPKVRSNLSFYPESTGRYLGEARQADRWLNEMDDDELTPMIRLGKGRAARDFFIFEPALLTDGTVWMPHRWLTKMTSKGMVVNTNDERIVGEGDLLLPFNDLNGQEDKFGLTCSVSSIEDTLAPCGEILPWTLTDPKKGNRWRERAHGHRVLSFLMWLYCNDTSGNTSKRWNEHNSFLFTAAGLNRTNVSKEYNIHFLCTSNSAPPLEMMDGVVDQIQDGQTHGIWAWDGEKGFDEPVLLIPGVLALLGDNPMQSEFACHIGLRGKMFCRACKVKGKEFKNVHGEEKDDDDRGSEVDGDSSDEDDNDSVTSVSSKASGGGKKGRRKKFIEGLEAMRARVYNFIKPGAPRTRSESINQLNEHFHLTKQIKNDTRMKKERTRTGLKDTYQMFFVDKLLKSYKSRRTDVTKTLALNRAVQDLPLETMSPVWRIRGLNPHADTPVEILHVVLLGFVKYLWRDVIQNQLKKKAEKMAELSARLSSTNVDGLGLASFLAGDTLTKYYGSLTGGDFRKIAQVAPFVLHGLVSEDCYQTWVVLSKLIPLIWQPEITDVSKYVDTLESEITNFLVYAGKWSIRWFNKPKFHILVHLPAHIRRFGPAILFATEAFESYNAVIRCKSTHSNRQAPSRDIAFAFAQANRIRHMFSGGQFLVRGGVEWTESTLEARKVFNQPDLPQSQ
ncbi:hypothetical protein PQX77_005252 [Marasmius sp. AFHP31]|nr:hypothetical protein PQX77_005252 [Marasmius sp. AFHP31]